MFESKIEVADTKLGVRSWGEQGLRTVLCWHGVGLASPASRTFDGVAQLLVERGLHVVALDAPGFGMSPPLDPERYHPHALADLIPPLLDTLELDRAIALGYSWGGDVACHVAARHPQRLSGLVLLDAGYRDPPFDPAIPYETYVRQNEQKAEALEPLVEPWVIAAAERGMALARPSETRGAIAASKLPVLLIAAGDAPPVALARFTHDVPQAEVHPVEGSGHNVLADGGAVVAGLLAEWSRRAGLGADRDAAKRTPGA